MTLKWIGAILIIGASGGFGLKLAALHLNEERTLRQFITVLDYMSCELQYHLTPLPTLCRQAAMECRGVLSDTFLCLAFEMENQISPDVDSCMQAAVTKCNGLPSLTLEAMELLGRSLGKFDINGQLTGLDAVRQNSRRVLEALNQNRDVRLRGYQTLALCAGAALVILFI